MSKQQTTNIGDIERNQSLRKAIYLKNYNKE